MELYITEFSKYFITLFIMIYTLESFLVFRYKEESQRNGLYTRQNIMMFLTHFTCFLAICFQTGEISYLFFYAFQQIILYAAVVLFRLLYPKSNRLVINNMCMLLSVSFIILTRLSWDKAIRQFIIVAFSLVVAFIVPFFIHKLKFLKNLSWVYAIIGIVALSIVLILGQTTYGSKISYSIAGITFQPSEFVKIVFVFFIASALYKASGLLEVSTTAVIAAIHVIVLVLSKDLGSALIFFIVYVFMVYIASQKFIYVLLGTSGGVAASIVAYHFFSHVQVRVQAWRDPWSVIDSAGYQITQSLFAISSGTWFGLGLFQGTPRDIPFVEADFIFSAIAEELGIVFAICLILICISSFLMFMNISTGLKDKFYQLIAFGLGVTYIFQVFLTIGGGTKFIPLTGVTLPLISYGGTSILTTLLMFSIIEGLSIIRQEESEKPIKKKKRRKNKSYYSEDELESDIEESDENEILAMNDEFGDDEDE